MGYWLWVELGLRERVRIRVVGCSYGLSEVVRRYLEGMWVLGGIL